MVNVDISKVEIRRVNKAMNGLFATQDIAGGDIIFNEEIIVFENTHRENPLNIPDVVALVARVWAGDHVDSLSRLGFKPSIWTLPPAKKDKKWLTQLNIQSSD